MDNLIIDPERTYHVIPSFPGEPEHSNDTDAPCWCGPRRELVCGQDGVYGTVWVHERPT